MLSSLLTHKRVKNYCLLLIFINSLMIGLSFTRTQRVTLSGAPFGGDFIEFYNSGRILNTYGARRLYDFQLQEDLTREFLPGFSVPYVTPPFVAILFSPLAYLPFWLAYLAWIVISIALYLCATSLSLRLEILPRGMTILVCLAFPPFLMLVIAGGQISAIGCFIFAGWLYLMKRERKFLAGAVLGLLLYKPTLAVFIVPTLLLGRQFRTMMGFAMVSGLLMIVLVWMLGTDGSIRYLAVLREFSSLVGSGYTRAATPESTPAAPPAAKTTPTAAKPSPAAKAAPRPTAAKSTATKKAVATKAQRPATKAQPTKEASTKSTSPRPAAKAAPASVAPTMEAAGMEAPAKETPATARATQPKAEPSHRPTPPEPSKIQTPTPVTAATTGEAGKIEPLGVEALKAETDELPKLENTEPAQATATAERPPRRSGGIVTATRSPGSAGTHPPSTTRPPATARPPAGPPEAVRRPTAIRTPVEPDPATTDAASPRTDTRSAGAPTVPPPVREEDADKAVEAPGRLTSAARKTLRRRRLVALLVFIVLAVIVLVVGQFIRAGDGRKVAVSPVASALAPGAEPGAGIGEPTAAETTTQTAATTAPTAAATTAAQAPADTADTTPTRAAAGALNAFTFASGYGPVLGTTGTVRRFKVAVEKSLGQGNGGDFADEVDRTLGDPRSWIGGRPVPAAAGADGRRRPSSPSTWPRRRRPSGCARRAGCRPSGTPPAGCPAR